MEGMLERLTLKSFQSTARKKYRPYQGLKEDTINHPAKKRHVFHAKFLAVRRGKKSRGVEETKCRERKTTTTIRGGGSTWSGKNNRILQRRV